MKTSTKAYYNT